MAIPKGRILVTGAAGHVGANLIRALLEEGHQVRALVQPGANNRGVEGLDVERVEGDVRDFGRMKEVTQDCARVFHVAAKISTLDASAGEQREIFGINVLGTRHVMRAALENDVERVVLTGSFSAVGYDPDDPSKPGNEDMPFYPFDTVVPYARSKALAEHETLKAVADGLDAVIATSCAVIGSNDFLPSRMGNTICDFANGKLKAYVPGGFDFVAARDIVQGHMLAMEKGRRGHKYIFSSEFKTLDDLLGYFEQFGGRKRPKLRLPPQVLSAITGFAYRAFPNTPQRLTPGAIRILRMHRHADTTKAREELGYQPTKIEDAVGEAFEFFVREGKIQRPEQVPVPRAAAAE